MSQQPATAPSRRIPGSLNLPVLVAVLVSVLAVAAAGTLQLESLLQCPARTGTYHIDRWGGLPNTTCEDGRGHLDFPGW